MKCKLMKKKIDSYVKELTTRNSKDFHFLVVCLLVLLVRGLININCDTDRLYLQCIEVSVLCGKTSVRGYIGQKNNL